MMSIRSVLQIACFSSSQKAAAATAFLHASCNYRSKEWTSARSFSAKTNSEKSTRNEEEIEKFQQQAEDWWDTKSTFSVLVAMNKLRVPLVRDGILSTRSPQYERTAKPLKGFTVLDVGCGGGLLSEPLARIGANVTGLDPGSENIKAAQNHAQLDSEIRNNLEYVCGTVEDLCGETTKYDAVACSEVIEHVDNVEHFVKCCVDLVEDNGSLFFTTINRTAFSYFSAILLAEYALGIVPRGTHDWKKFISPQELKHMLSSRGCKTLLTRGMIYNPVCKSWSWSQYDGVSYALHAVKEN